MRRALALGLALAVGLFAGALLRRLHAAPAAPPPASPPRVVIDDTSDLRRALDDARAESERLERALAERQASLAVPSPDAVEPSAPEPRGPVFRTPDLDEALDALDWPAIATALGGMHDAVTRLLASPDALRGDMPPDLRGELQRHNGALVTAAVAAQQHGIPGPSANAAFTHPHVMANAAAARLAAAGRGLSAEQVEAIGALLEASTTELARIEETEYELQLLRWIDEVSARRTFLDGLFAALDPEQQAALCPPEARHRVGLDLFSEGLMAISHVHPVPFHDRSALASSCAALVTSRFGIPEEQHDEARAIVREWVDALPEAHLAAPADDFDRAGRLHADRIVAAARDQVPLLRRLLAELELDDDARARIRKLTVPLLPLRRDA